MGVSLGGYYAPRAAAFEKRFKACICWGAIWDFSAHFERVFEDGRKAGSIPDMVKHAMWVFGQSCAEGAFKVAKELRCAPFADRITCPLLILHGENDRQISVDSAHKLFAAATNAVQKNLKIFTVEEGGAEHCQINNRTIAGDVMGDWAAEVFGGAVNGAF
jgi:dipeptidyl aminopeptidase/acylaminoacyl peptidase